MKRHNLTLIEIMGVVALIVILALIGVAAYSHASDSSKEKATTATIARVENAFGILKDKGFDKLRTTSATATNGFVTVTIDVDNKVIKLGNENVGGSKTAKQEEAFKLFTQAISAENIEQLTDENNIIVDGWDQKLLLRYPGKFKKGGVDIISAGSDGFFGKEETGDAETVPPVDIDSYKDEDGEAVCDDVANFL